MKKLGLIGRNIGYSFSREYFAKKFQQMGLSDYQYVNFDIESLNFIEEILQTPELIGANVTIPYKKEIIPYIDSISSEAKKIGAINTIKIEKGKTIGYNTDAFGFEKTLDNHLTNRNIKALVLGNGGAAGAVNYVLDSKNIHRTTVARNSNITFDNIDSDIVKSHLLIIQCTPVGTFPNVNDTLPFPFENITDKHLVIDLIYNPEETLFMRKCKEKKAKTVNGKEMLIAQAEKAWEIWTA